MSGGGDELGCYSVAPGPIQEIIASERTKRTDRVRSLTHPVVSC